MSPDDGRPPGGAPEPEQGPGAPPRPLILTVAHHAGLELEIHAEDGVVRLKGRGGGRWVYLRAEELRWLSHVGAPAALYAIEHPARSDDHGP